MAGTKDFWRGWRIAQRTVRGQVIGSSVSAECWLDPLSQTLFTVMRDTGYHWGHVPISMSGSYRVINLLSPTDFGLAPSSKNFKLGCPLESSSSSFLKIHISLSLPCHPSNQLTEHSSIAIPELMFGGYQSGETLTRVKQRYNIKVIFTIWGRSHCHCREDIWEGR